MEKRRDPVEPRTYSIFDKSTIAFDIPMFIRFIKLAYAIQLLKIIKKSIFQSNDNS